MTTFSHMRTRSRRFIATAVLGLGCAAMLADGPAAAQDALGRGDALDANPGVGTGGRNAPAQTPDFRARNLLITGDVAGGRAFRDAVGYTAAGDFRDELGSDDLFRFRADAAISSPRFAGLGRVADPFRFGQDLAMIEFRRDPMPEFRPRAPEGVTDLDRRIDRVPGDDWQVAERFSQRMYTVDPIGTDRLRDMQRPVHERPVGMTLTPDGEWQVASASPLHGISRRDEQVERQLQGLSPLDIARVRDDFQRGRTATAIGMPPELSFRERLRMEPEPTTQWESGRVDDSRVVDDEQTPYVQVLSRIAQRYAGVDGLHLPIDPSVLDELDEEFAELREALQAMRRPRGFDEAIQERIDPWSEEGEDEEVDPRIEPDEAADPLDRFIPERAEPRRRPLIDDEEDEEPRTRRPFDPEQFDQTIELLRHGHQIDRLALADGTRVNELILSGQSSLRRGDYFTAESRFARAMQLAPDHPMASIGLVHAQLGAGLSQAAAITLYNTLTRYPELIDARFDSALLPQPQRLDEIVEELKEQLDDELLGDQAGLLLAYLGHQRGERNIVKRGLDVIEGIDSDDPLLPLLQGVWLADDAESPEK